MSNNIFSQDFGTIGGLFDVIFNDNVYQLGQEVTCKIASEGKYALLDGRRAHKNSLRS